MRRLTALATIQAVTAVEVFMNLWFRSFVEETKSEDQKKSLLEDLRQRIPLEQRLAKWPRRYLGNKIDLRVGPGHAFVKLKNLRNSVVHFETAYETVRAPQLIVHGLADTSAYDGLTSRSAESALTVAEDFVAEMFRLAGYESATIKCALIAWIGKRDSAASTKTPNVGLPSWLAPHVER